MLLARLINCEKPGRSIATIEHGVRIMVQVAGRSEELLRQVSGTPFVPQCVKARRVPRLLSACAALALSLTRRFTRQLIQPDAPNSSPAAFADAALMLALCTDTGSEEFKVHNLKRVKKAKALRPLVLALAKQKDALVLQK